MRFWKKCRNIQIRIVGRLAALLAALPIAACAPAPAALEVRGAQIEGAVLRAQIAWRPAAQVQEALDHGIPLDFVVRVTAQSAPRFGLRRTVAERQRHLQLRYYPLSRQYQWADLDLQQARSYGSRALALAALDDLRLPLPDWRAPQAESYRVAIALDRGALPGALRLAALLRPAWWLASPEYVWAAAAG
jgi:hypothetical protein